MIFLRCQYFPIATLNAFIGLCIQKCFVFWLQSITLVHLTLLSHAYYKSPLCSHLDLLPSSQPQDPSSYIFTDPSFFKSQPPLSGWPLCLDVHVFSFSTLFSTYTCKPTKNTHKKNPSETPNFYLLYFCDMTMTKPLSRKNSRRPVPPVVSWWFHHPELQNIYVALIYSRPAGSLRALSSLNSQLSPPGSTQLNPTL